MLQRFSMGFKSGEQTGHCMILPFLVKTLSKYSVISLAACKDALSCMKPTFFGMLSFYFSASSKLGCYLVFKDELTYPLLPRTSSPMGWGQCCELFLLQIQLQNTRRCCLWSSLNSLHLWNLNGFTFSFFCKILLALEKSNFLAIWRIKEVGFSCISWIISRFDGKVVLEIWLPG